MRLDKFGFEVTERIAIIGVSGEYTTELNRVSYNGYPPKLDLRKWLKDKPLKGIMLSESEAYNLYEVLQKIYGGEEE